MIKHETFANYLQDKGYEAISYIHPYANREINIINGDYISTQDLDKTKYAYLHKAYLHRLNK